MLYSIEQFYENENIGGGSFSRDETKLLYHSNKSGIYNIYEKDLSTLDVRQVTNSTVESFFAIAYANEEGDILYSSDKGGDENDHIYLLQSNGETKDLTPEEGSKASFFGFSKDKSILYYISNKRNLQFFDLYKMRVGTWESEMIYENNDGMDVGLISDDENLLVLSKAVTTSESLLFIFNRETKVLKEISSPETPGSYGPTDFTYDGKFLEYITDVDKEFTYLVQYDLATGERKTIYETTWDVVYAYNSLGGKYKVIGVNEDAKNNVILIDNNSNSPVTLPVIADGDILQVVISDSEDKIRLTVGSSKAPSNLYVYDIHDNKLTQLTNTLNATIKAQDLVEAKVVRYPSFDGLEIPAIYYKPHQATIKDKVPALILVHGGPGGQSRIGYAAFIQYLVNHGYAILAVNNRGSSGYGKSFYKMDDLNHGDKDLKDCIWGKKWLQTQDYIDGERIGIIGGSYGGYMTMAALAFAPEEFQVGVNIFGVTNWLRTLKSIPPYWESYRTAIYKELGDPFSADSIRLHKISPLFHTDQVSKPLMVLQGAQDPRVLQVESDEIVEGVRKNGVPVEYVLFPDEGHGFVKKENEIKGYGQILGFLDKYLRPLPDSK